MSAYENLSVALTSFLVTRPELVYTRLADVVWIVVVGKACGILVVSILLIC